MLVTLNRHVFSGGGECIDLGVQLLDLGSEAVPLRVTAVIAARV